MSGISVVPQGQNANNWVNPAAFTAPPSDPTTGVIQRFGNAGRGIITAPITWQIDVSLEKKIKLTERFTLEFTAQAFNVFNHDQLADPNLTLNYNPPDASHPAGGYISVPGGFGQITSLVNVNSNSDKFAADNTGSGLPRQICKRWKPGSHTLTQQERHLLRAVPANLQKPPQRVHPSKESSTVAAITVPANMDA